MVSGAWSSVAAAAGLLGPAGEPVPTVFARMSALAAQTGAINLGQGFPDTDGPRSLLEDAATAILSGANQYPPLLGVPALRKAIAAHQATYYGLSFSADSEVLVTAGATEGLTATIMALCSPGDEVILLEPYYDSYAAAIEMASAVCVPVPLSSPSFALDGEELASAVTSRTRLVVLNSPHNPTGRVFSPAELAAVASLAIAHDLIVVADEVYEHLTFAPLVHTPLATLPGMRDRVVTISSAGKTFSVTGWKIGWVCASPPLIEAITAVKQFLTYVNGSPFQTAIASALALPSSFFASLASSLASRSALLTSGLAAAGFAVRPSEGTYFVVADAAPLGYSDGAVLCDELPSLCGVVGVPMSAFMSSSEPSSLVRFACCKRSSVIEEAASRLSSLSC